MKICVTRKLEPEKVKNLVLTQRQYYEEKD